MSSASGCGCVCTDGAIPSFHQRHRKCGALHAITISLPFLYPYSTISKLHIVQSFLQATIPSSIHSVDVLVFYSEQVLYVFEYPSDF